MEFPTQPSSKGEQSLWTAKIISSSVRTQEGTVSGAEERGAKKALVKQGYGIRADMQLDYDCPYSYNTVAKVIRENGLLHHPNSPKGLTKADKAAQKSDNLLKRDFTADAPEKE